MNEELRVFLFTSVRELLVNVAKHSCAQKVKVSVRRSGETISIHVADDGVGFGVSKKSPHIDENKGGRGHMKIKILLADDHKIIREGLRALIERQSDMEVAAEAEDGLETVKLARKLSPDIVIMDIGMPGMNGIDATRQIVAEGNNIRVIALSMHSDRRFVLQMLKAGASGYLLKDSAFEELVIAIHTIMKKQPYLSPKVTDVMVKEYLHNLSKNESTAFSILTVREREVLQLIAEGKSTKQIASILNISVKTIETHRQQVMEKVGVHSIAELTKYAIREGLTSLEG